MRRLLAVLYLLLLGSVGLPPNVLASGNSTQAHLAQRHNLDDVLAERAGKPGFSRVIVTARGGSDATDVIRKAGGRVGRRLNLIGALVAELPNVALQRLADHPLVERIDWDRPTHGQLALVANSVGARLVQHAYGYDGAGVGVAVIDSGIANWHDDLTYSGSNASVVVNNNQRVAAFVDFVNGGTVPYDDYGHGTHVSGIISGNGFDSRGSRAGIAPAAHLVSLKVLDKDGRGVISNVIAALEYAVTNRAAYNIRVVNLSVGAAVRSSYTIDPLTLAAKRAVEAGLVVVAAAGNLGRTTDGRAQYGGITAPGNAPWVLTVGASNHQGTLNRRDDTVAPFSSRGPTAIDFAAKPDLVAPGVGVTSLSAPGSTLYTTKASYLLAGSISTSSLPYLTLTGTSMAAPVVSGTVALMLQANPSLTPNLVKALLQYTAQVQPQIHFLAQGAGFLNAKGAVDLARYFATATLGQHYPLQNAWGRTIIWGNRRLGGGVIRPSGNAWDVTTVWGAAFDLEGDNVVWGTLGQLGDHVVWGTGLLDGDNVVWGTLLDGDNVVWGTLLDSDNVVWGTDCGGNDCEGVVWGTVDGDNVVWGTLLEGDNVVWGTSGAVEDEVWATSDTNADNVLWDSSGEGTVISDPLEWELLLEPAATDDTTTILVSGLIGVGPTQEARG